MLQLSKKRDTQGRSTALICFDGSKRSTDAVKLAICTTAMIHLISVYLFIMNDLPIYLTHLICFCNINLSVHLSFQPSIYPWSVCLSVCLPIYLSVCPPVCLPVCRVHLSYRSIMIHLFVLTCSIIFCVSAVCIYSSTDLCKCAPTWPTDSLTHLLF